MRVLLIGNYPHDGQESMQRFTAMMHEGLLAAGIAVETLIPRPCFGQWKKSGHGLGKWLGYLDKFVLFPIQLRRKLSALNSQLSTPTIVHICDHSNAIYTRDLQEIPHVVTCHDVLALRSARGDFPENRTGWTGRQLQRLIFRGLQRARHIACVSLPTREQLLEITGIPPERTSFVESGLNYPYAPMAPEEARRVIDEVLLSRGYGKVTGRPFLLHVGGEVWYKNRDGLVRLYLQLRRQTKTTPMLLLIGPPVTGAQQSVIDAEDPSAVFAIGKLSNEELRAFYSVAEALVFPSQQEGFGWPIVEAQACGCPVATSNRAPMNQIGGTAAVYFDPDDLAAAAATVGALLAEQGEARRARITASLENAARFSTDTMIRRYLDLYRTLL